MRKTYMPKQYTLKQYISATQQLADHHGLVVVVFEKGGKALVFKVLLKTAESVPIESWAITTTGGDNPKVASAEYLLKPAQNIRGAQQKEFDAIIEMMIED